MQILPKINCGKANIKANTLKELYSVCKQCNGCILSKSRTTVVFGQGNVDAPIMLIAEAPGIEDDALGLPFIGKSGQLLNQFLKDAGIDKDTDIYFSNVVKCKPPQNRVPTNEEKSVCRAYLLGQIAIIKPKIMLLCGSIAAESFIDKEINVSELRGKWLNVFENTDTMIIFHPSYLLRNHSVEENSPRWLMNKDLLKVKAKLSELRNSNEQNRIKN